MHPVSPKSKRRGRQRPRRVLKLAALHDASLSAPSFASVKYAWRTRSGFFIDVVLEARCWTAARFRSVVQWSGAALPPWHRPTQALLTQGLGLGSPSSGASKSVPGGRGRFLSVALATQPHIFKPPLCLVFKYNTQMKRAKIQSC